MSELAYDAEGDRFEVPANAAGWRVRRFRNVGARGAPEVVFGDDGRPLVLPVDAGIDEFRGAVAAVPGRYRLDPVDTHGRAIEKVPAAYLQFGDAQRVANGGAAVSTPGTDAMLGEVVRANAEMVKVIAEKFGSVMEAAATLLKAADGAGLPARKPHEPLRNAGGEGEDEGDDQEEDDDEEEGEPGFGEFLGQIMPLVQMVMGRQSSKAPRPVRNAAPIIEVPSASPAAEAKPPKAPAPITPAMLAHFQAVQSQLTAEEADFARAVAAELSPAEIEQWMVELSAMAVDDAVAMIQKHIAGKEGAS